MHANFKHGTNGQEFQWCVSRLDPVLYKKCHKDAQNLCNAPDKWANHQSMQPELGPLVLPCLYRFMKENESGKKVRPLI